MQGLVLFLRLAQLPLPRSLSSFRAPPFIAVSSINPFLVLLSGRCFGRASGNFLFPRPISISLRNERIEHGRVRAEIVHHPSHPSVGLCFDLSDRTRRKPHHRSEEHTSELQSLMRISYAVFCLKKKKKHIKHIQSNTDSETPHLTLLYSHT